MLIAIFIIAAAVSAYLGYFLRKRFDKKKRVRLIEELEALLKQELPRFKKGRQNNEVNWERVFKLLKKEPKTSEVLWYREQVEEQIRLYYSRRAR